MAEVQSSTKGLSSSNARAAQKKSRPAHEIYSQPAPIKTFPLPTFLPSNPVSLLYLAYAWFGQIFRPPPAEPAVVHHGVWSPATNSVHITDEKSIRALWEQGFYGKGNLSRSEPNWLKREQVRGGLENTHVSEILTAQRREERAQAKWERARLEQEAIRRTRAEEARQAEARRIAKEQPRTAVYKPFAAPVGPLQLLALPNSLVELQTGVVTPPPERENQFSLPPPEDLPPELTHLDFTSEPAVVPKAQPRAPDAITPVGNNSAASLGEPRTSNAPTTPELSSDSSEGKSIKRQKSVRFSPNVDSTTFQHYDPPSPNHTPTKPKANGSALTSGIAGSRKAKELVDENDSSTGSHVVDAKLVSREHLQLTPEEAFFLIFGLGALSVTDSSSGQLLSTSELLTTFRQYSYFPPQLEPDEVGLAPDDGFLLHYAVYHHFRSLGWVPRGGIKFGVDWLLYTRGPVFDHAEFGLIVIPSYSDQEWKRRGKQSPQKEWSWLHSLVRVLAHVTKSLVLVYVDVPPPRKFDEAMEKGFTEALRLYKIREVIVKRWSSNRNR